MRNLDWLAPAVVHAFAGSDNVSHAATESYTAGQDSSPDEAFQARDLQYAWLDGGQTMGRPEVEAFEMLDGKKSDEFLNELAIRLATSAHQLSEAAKRLQLAELTYREYLVRLRRLDEHLCTLIDLLQGPSKGQEPPVSETNPEFCDPPPPPPPRPKKLRYADYIEFSNFSELKKFEKMGEITEEDAKNFDGDDAMKRLLDGEPPEQKKKE